MSDNAFDDFLNRVKAARGLLKAEEEVELAKRIEAGLLAADVLSSGRKTAIKPPPTKNELMAVVTDGEVAMEHMILSNVLLVAQKARDYEHIPEVPAEELMAVGIEGLMHAIELFDYTKGYKFSTYAVLWIEKGIRRRQAQLLYGQGLGRTEAEKVQWQVGATNRLRNELSRRPADNGIPREPTDADIAKKVKQNVADVTLRRRFAEQPESLIINTKGDGELDMTEMLADPRVVDPEDEVEVSFRNGLIARMLDEVGLTDQERKVIELRFGFTEVPKWHKLEGGATHGRIARLLGKTSAVRVQRLEQSALAKLRLSKHSADLSENW